MFQLQARTNGDVEESDGADEDGFVGAESDGSRVSHEPTAFHHVSHGKLCVTLP